MSDTDIIVCEFLCGALPFEGVPRSSDPDHIHACAKPRGHTGLIHQCACGDAWGSIAVPVLSTEIRTETYRMSREDADALECAPLVPPGDTVKPV